MRSSSPVLLLLVIAAGLSACARAAKLTGAIRKSWIAASSRATPPQTAQPTKKEALAKPIYAAQTATLDVTFGLAVRGVASLPVDFVPDMTRAPRWLQNGTEIGIIGSTGGKTAMLGFGGAKLARRRIIVEDFGAGAPEGRLLDIAISPDGGTIATAVAAATQPRLNVDFADPANPADVYPIATLDGEFDAAQLTWLGNSKIALVVQAAGPAVDGLTAEVGAVPVSGLYLITASKQSSIQRLDEVRCPLSPLVFSPNGYFAVAQGDGGSAPAIVDVHDGACKTMDFRGPIHVLGWAPNSLAFLYTTTEQSGVFHFDLIGSRNTPIAISSGAAAYATDGTIIALGSKNLTWQRAAAEPGLEVKAQIALFDPYQSLKTINSLGFETQPALLAQSTMVFSEVSNDGIIDTAVPGVAGPVREVIEYSYPARAAFVLAHGTVQGPVAISWSPDGKLVAIIDGNSTRRTVAVLAPPE